MKIIRTAFLLATLLVGLSLSAPAAISYAAYDNYGVIPDDTTTWFNTATVSGLQQYITSVSVTLNISGGWNGDLYAYLSYGGQKLVLLNRVGVGTGSELTFSLGYSDAGFGSVVLQDGGASGDIHGYGGAGVPTGIYSADGRDVSPVVLTSDDATALYGAGRQTFSGQFGGMNPNGDWTLAIADMSGDGQSTVVGWGLGITAVPEPMNVAAGLFAAVFAAFHLFRFARQKSASPVLAPTPAPANAPGSRIP